MHTHAGRPNRTGPVDQSVLATMAPGGMAAAVVSAIADLPMIRRNRDTRRLEKIRDPDPGECLQCVDDYLASFEATGMRIAREPHEIRANDPALVLAVEGCDFLEGDLDRLDALEARGVRSIQLTHYLVNETGDIQTAPPVHGGLTRVRRGGGAADEPARHHRRCRALLRGHGEGRGRRHQPADPVHPRQPEGARPSGRRSSALSQPGLCAHGGRDRRRDRRLDRRAVAGTTRRPDPPHVPADRRGRHRPCRHRHRSARRRGETGDAGFLPPP